MDSVANASKAAERPVYLETKDLVVGYDGTPLIGDVNIDGIVDICDATAIQRHIADLEPLSGQALALADTNGDGAVDISDVTRLQEYIAGYDIVLG